MNRFGIVFGTSIVSLLLASCSRPNTNQTNASPAIQSRPITSVSVVKASTVPLTISPGNSADASVRLTIDSGYHVNANPASFPYLKATELQIDPPRGISVGSIVYPNPVTKTFPFAEKPLAVYEGEVILKARLKADSSAVNSTHNVPAKIRIQACDNQVCYAPGTLDLSLPVTIQQASK